MFWLKLLVFILYVEIVKAQSEYTDPHCHGKQVIVELFEWKFSDIANECERFLGDKDFCGVQVSPVTEHALFGSSWYELYQPVSYKIQSRAGNEAEFKNMVDRCRNVGVRIYVDVVMNHMAEQNSAGRGIGGSVYNTTSLDFPGVPYTHEHFNNRSKCPSKDGLVHNYDRPDEVRSCYYPGMADLDQSNSYVRSKIANYLNHLIDLGVAGFRIDSAKYMYPADILAIQNLTKNLPEDGRPFFVHQVEDLGQDFIKSKEYYPNGRVTEFRYSKKLYDAMKNFTLLDNITRPESGICRSDHALVFVDNHETQRSGPGNTVTHKTPRDYIMANAFMLANDYGFTRIMSSYFFGDNLSLGPPHYSINNSLKTPIINITDQGTCGNGWVCEHRWPSIARMVAFRNDVVGTAKKFWRNENGHVSFARGLKGFFAMAKDGYMNETLQTGLPDGIYCDLITNCKKTVTVDKQGFAKIIIDNKEEPILAFIVEGPLSNPKTHQSIHSGSVIGNVIGSGGQISVTRPSTSFTSTAISEITSEIQINTTVSPTTAVVKTIFSTISPTTVEIKSSATRGKISHPTTGNGHIRHHSTTLTSISPTTPPQNNSGNECFQRTIIFFEDITITGQDLFIRGGIDDKHRSGCEDHVASTNNCSIPIRSHSLGESDHYAKHNAWRIGDDYLDWFGSEPHQGSFGSTTSSGTPAVWTTNDPNDQKGRYNKENIYGPHYWLADIEMDCCKTIRGWFEVKAIINGHWENDIHDRLNGCQSGRTPPYENLNHWARCGMKNIFHINQENCIITNI